MAGWKKSNKKPGGQKWRQGKTKVKGKKQKNGSIISETVWSALKMWSARYPRWEESFVMFLQGSLGKTWEKKIFFFFKLEELNGQVYTSF